MTRTTRLNVGLLVCALAGMLIGQPYVWHWGDLSPITGTTGDGDSNLLTDNNGAHAVGMTEYDNGSMTWGSIISERRYRNHADPWMFAYEYEDMGWNGQGWVWEFRGHNTYLDSTAASSTVKCSTRDSRGRQVPHGVYF